MKRFPLLATVVLLLAVAGCGSSSKSSSSTTSSAPATSNTPSAGGPQVTMKNLAFVPTSIGAKVGQTVSFSNNDSAPHNVTYVSGPKFTSSGTLSPGQSFSFKVTQAGTIHYVCTIHPFMKGTIVVSK